MSGSSVPPSAWRLLMVGAMFALVLACVEATMPLWEPGGWTTFILAVQESAALVLGLVGIAMMVISLRLHGRLPRTPKTR